MQRLIRSFNTLTEALKETLQEQYPDGIDATHIKSIPTAKGEILRVIELSTPDALYLIKINSESRAEIEEFLDQEDSAGEDSDIDEGGSEIEADAGEGADDADAEEDDADDDDADADDVEDVTDEDDEDL
jgi:hypothetical protein